MHEQYAMLSASPEKGDSKLVSNSQKLQQPSLQNHYQTTQTQQAMGQSGKTQNKSFDNQHQLYQNQQTPLIQNSQKLLGAGNSIVQSSSANTNSAANINKQQSNNSQTTHNAQAYDELKRRLLNEYKKLCSNKKSFDEQVRERYKNIKERSTSGKKSSNQHNSSSLSKKPNSSQTQQNSSKQTSNFNT